jgi:hypothetical protein
MNEMAVQGALPLSPADARALAIKMSVAYEQRVRQIKHEQGLTTEAAAVADKTCSISRLYDIEDCPADRVKWDDLMELNRTSPERALRRWEQLKEAAREDVKSGEWAAAVLEGRDASPLQRARFLALREELAAEWQPKNGIERQLIDQMTQAQTALFSWLHRLATDDYLDADKAAAMVDRFNRMFLRTLRALRDLRRYAPTVVVQNAGQVNVGAAQVNVNRPGPRRPARRCGR